MLRILAALNINLTKYSTSVITTLWYKNTLCNNLECWKETFLQEFVSVANNHFANLSHLSLDNAPSSLVRIGPAVIARYESYGYN